MLTLSLRRLLFVTALLFANGIGHLLGQSDAETRALEWQAYKVPAVDFRRYADPTGRLFFRVPAEWQQAGEASKFIGPDGAEATAFVEKIPDGYSLKGYLAALLQHFTKVPGAADAVRIRPIEMSGLEGREVLIALFDEQGAVSRRNIWCTLEGDTAISFLFICPDASAEALEPYFKGIAQSATLLKSKAYYEDYTRRLEETGLVRESAKIEGVHGIAAALESSQEARKKSTGDLAALLRTEPDACLDLFLDRRPLVRGALFNAVAESRSDKLLTLVYDALEDPSAWVAEKAARCLASFPDPLGIIRRESSSWSTDIMHVVRLFPFLKGEEQTETIGALLQTGKNTFTAGERSLYYEAALQLIEISPERYRFPISELIAKKDPELTRMVLETAAARNEKVEDQVLLGLLSHSDSRVGTLAARVLANSKGPKVEKEVAKRITRLEKAAKRSATEEAVLRELHRSQRSLLFRGKIDKAKGEQRRLLVEEALKDQEIGGWVWTEFGSSLKGDNPIAAKRETQAESQVDKHDGGAFGEKILPERPALYTAIPDPARAFSRLDTLLAGVKMHSTRDQATFAVMMSSSKELVAKAIGIAPNKLDFASQGIAPHSPAVFTTWRAEGVPRTAAPQRSAILLSVTDRDRFEQLLAGYQQKRGGIASLPVGVATMSRLIGLMPAMIPGFAQAMLLDQASGEAKGREKAEEKKAEIIYTTVRGVDLASFPLKVFERRRSGLRGLERPEHAYLAYVGNMAVVAPDLDSMGDLLRRLGSEGRALKDNEEFQAIRKLDGEAIYFSELESLAKGAKRADHRTLERGRLVIGDERIDNEYHLSFTNETGEEPFLSFHPSELSAPEKLLPAASIVYYFMKLAEVKDWPKELKQLMSYVERADLQKAFQPDVEKEILPELGPECGAALVDVITLKEEFRIPWVIFFALRSERLIKAQEQGRLFNGAREADGSTRLKIRGTDVCATIRNGYLIFAADSKTLERLEDPRRLKDAADYRRSVEAVNGPLVAFGGVNTQATVRQAGEEVDVRTARAVNALGSLARAFHNLTLSGEWHGDSVDFRMSTSTDREGAYSVSDLAVPAADFDMAFAVVRAGGVSVIDTTSTTAVRLRVSTKGGHLDERLIKELESPYQKLERDGADSLILTVQRRPKDEWIGTILPITAPELAPELRPTREIRPDDPQIQAKAREIAGDEKDAWKVACKLADWTFSNLKWKLVEHRDATETLAAKEADCLEFSQLYIAMARSLGLPARLVTGFAWSSGSFTGHAWVEVYVGKWVELDPTLGSHSVGAFHIRETSGQVLVLGALNALKIDVLEAVREHPKSQEDPRALLEDICRQLPDGEKHLILAALDPSTLVAEYLAPLSWAELSDEQRRLFVAAYEAALAELTAFDKETEFRVLSVEERGDRAAGYVLEHSGLLLIFRLVKHDGLWNLVDVEQSDLDHRIVGEILGAALLSLPDGTHSRAVGQRFSPYQRLLLKVSTDAAGALVLADQALGKEPGLKRISLLKALALLRLERGDESTALLGELVQSEAYAPALLQLARHYENNESEWERAAEFYRQYSGAVPADPRPHSALATLYRSHEKPAEAEREYREAMRCDPTNSALSLDLAEFFAVSGKSPQALAEIDRGADDESRKERFATLMGRLYGHVEGADQLADAEPARLTGNGEANLHLSQIRLYAGKAKEALGPAREAVKLSPEDLFSHGNLAQVLRTLDKVKEARESCERALKLDPAAGFLHYEMACILTRLGKKQEAVAALKKAFDDDEYLVEDVAEEEDLKPLAQMPEFVELMKSFEEPSEESGEESAAPEEKK